MKWYVKPKCTHAFILHLFFFMIKGLPNVLILYQLSHLMNFQINTWDSLPFKPISNLTMVCYHQNLIRRTLGLTILNTRGEVGIQAIDLKSILLPSLKTNKHDRVMMRTIGPVLLSSLKTCKRSSIWIRTSNYLQSF